MTRRVWIIGPVAIDRVIYVDQLPLPGSFTRPSRIVERIGGSSGNVALALAESGVETGFISYIGEDEDGRRIERAFSESKISHLHLQKILGESNHALVMVDRSGERTIVALSDSHLAEISVEQIEYRSDDIVVFSLWRPFFLEHFNRIKNFGCTMVVGLEALNDSGLSGADFAIGSEAELGGAIPSQHLGRFSTIVVTRGAAGVDRYCSGDDEHFDSQARVILDATGAGDSFLAGFLSKIALNEGDLRSAIEYGTRWAADTVAIEGSQPAPPPL